MHTIIIFLKWYLLAELSILWRWAAEDEQLQISYGIWENGTFLFISIDLGCRVARYPVEEEGGEAPLEEDGAPGHQVRDRLSLLLPSMPSKRAPQLPYLLSCHCTMAQAMKLRKLRFAKSVQK